MLLLVVVITYLKYRYVVIYFSILYARYRMGIVTDEMIGLPKSRFMAIGILEALGVASGMASAGRLTVLQNFCDFNRDLLFNTVTTRDFR